MLKYIYVLRSLADFVILVCKQTYLRYFQYLIVLKMEEVVSFELETWTCVF